MNNYNISIYLRNWASPVSWFCWQLSGDVCTEFSNALFARAPHSVRVGVLLYEYCCYFFHCSNSRSCGTRCDSSGVTACCLEWTRRARSWRQCACCSAARRSSSSARCSCASPAPRPPLCNPSKAATKCVPVLHFFTWSLDQWPLSMNS